MNFAKFFFHYKEIKFQEDQRRFDGERQTYAFLVSPCIIMLQHRIMQIYHFFSLFTSVLFFPFFFSLFVLYPLTTTTIQDVAENIGGKKKNK